MSFTDQIGAIAEGVKKTLVLADTVLERLPLLVERGIALMGEGSRLMGRGAALMDRATETLDRCDRALAESQSLVAVTKELAQRASDNALLERRRLELEIARLERGG
ncbi:MAG: hypothetical protein M5U28_52380 [Sandaracinaceae bacterium]|nr:hypothetical protein [Sandaracinaceae bacterium]